MLAPVLVFTPAQYKLRYYLLPALPALALLGAPAALRLWRTAPSRRLPAALAAGVGGAAVASVLLTLVWRHDALARSDRSTIEALASAVPGETAGLVAAAAVVVGLLAAALVARAWRAVLGGVGLAMAAWLLVGAPGLERRVSRRDSLKPFAAAVAARVPAGDALAFFGDPIRSVAVYWRPHDPDGAPAGGPRSGQRAHRPGGGVSASPACRYHRASAARRPRTDGQRRARPRLPGPRA